MMESRQEYLLKNYIDTGKKKPKMKKDKRVKIIDEDDTTLLNNFDEEEDVPIGN